MAFGDGTPGFPTDLDWGEWPFPIMSFELNATIAAGTLVSLTNGLLVNCGAAGAEPIAIGVIEIDGVAGDIRPVRLFGPVTVVKAGGTCTRGKPVDRMAAGLVQDYSSTTDDTYMRPGIFLGSGVTGEFVPVLCIPIIGTGSKMDGNT